MGETDPLRHSLTVYATIETKKDFRAISASSTPPPRSNLTLVEAALTRLPWEMENVNDDVATIADEIGSGRTSVQYQADPNETLDLAKGSVQRIMCRLRCSRKERRR
ncbi:hypothetical protein ACHAXR_010741 [Thalassiosira sp. AJA248-18]